jgi:hypothetical protein
MTGGISPSAAVLPAACPAALPFSGELQDRGRAAASHSPHGLSAAGPTPLRQRPAADDRGVATLELTVLFPVLLLLIFGVFQGALYFHSRNVALAAAQQGVRAGRADGVRDPAGTASAQARAFLAQTGELHNLTGVQITPTLNGGQLRITITGRAVSLLPGMPGPSFSQTAAGGLERFSRSTGGHR